MNINDIIALCPRNGNAIGLPISSEPKKFSQTIEGQIDAALLKLISQEEEIAMKHFYCGIYSAYTSMTIENCPWSAIRFMLDAANRWDLDEVKFYEERKGM